MKKSVIREAIHSGSWYSGQKSTLNQLLEGWLGSVPTSATNVISNSHKINVPTRQTCAIISPHAGYTYCGKTAAYGFKSINIDPIKRIFVLGPSHHVYFEDISLSICDEIETPLGNLTVDRQTIDALSKAAEFSNLSLEEEEEEHSLEMQFPFIYKAFESKIDEIMVVPAIVGNLDSEGEKYYGQVFAKYLGNSENLFVISSDFCHWGSRFRYQFYSTGVPPSENVSYLKQHATSRRNGPSSSQVTTEVDSSCPIHKSIQNLDLEAIKAISGKKSQPFTDYLHKTKNTICGRHPISVLLNAIELRNKATSTQVRSGVAQETADGSLNLKLSFIDYSQSSKIIDPSDSSVSYASGILYCD